MRHRTSSRVLLAVAAFVLLAVPAAAIAGTIRFSDVPPTDWAYNEIDWLAVNGVTKGCGDGTTFCPDDPVTRREMAVFLHRLSDGVVDAKTALTAADSDKLDGMDSTGFVSAVTRVTLNNIGVSVDPGEKSGQKGVLCPSGTTLIGGGGAGPDHLIMSDSFPNGNTWVTVWYNPTDSTIHSTIAAWAFCANI